MGKPPNALWAECTNGAQRFQKLGTAARAINSVPNTRAHAASHVALGLPAAPAACLFHRLRLAGSMTYKALSKSKRQARSNEINNRSTNCAGHKPLDAFAVNLSAQIRCHS